MTVFEIGTTIVAICGAVASAKQYWPTKAAAPIPKTDVSGTAPVVVPPASKELYIFAPDGDHQGYLAKMKQAMSKFPADFQLEQLYSGRSVAEALEAWAQREVAK